MSQPAFVCIGSVIIDDIVYPDGQTCMGVLGGGSTHAAAGMLMWGERPGLFSYIGSDLPDAVKARLERDFDNQGLIPIDFPQIRAWQIFEWNGKRTEIFRVDDPSTFLIGPPTDKVPTSYLKAKGVHLPDEAIRLPRWRALFPDAVLIWEPPPPYMIRANLDHFRETLHLVDIVSPNLLEAQSLYAIDNPAALVRAMLDDGAKVAALRMGEAGSLVGVRGERNLLALPAVPVPKVVDQTGAGNAYCGGFLVGWIKTGDWRTAACYAGVAASFTLEVIGVPEAPADLEQVRADRYNWLVKRVESRA
jgi:sugar/nucleoside kinase (ribokinase family)